MLNKKNLIYAGLFLASFLVINVGVFFFLKTTQPKVGARLAESKTVHAPGDSLAQASATLADSVRKDSTEHAAVPSPSSDTVAVSGLAAALPDTEAVQPAVSEATQLPADTALEMPDEETVEASPEESGEAVVTAAFAGDAKEMAKLAKLLESMKPAEAADIASHLSTDQIVTLVMKMKDRAAGKMLAALPIEQAARVAERMSQTASRSQGG